jgi:hypothetical protein
MGWEETDTELRLFIRYCRSLPALYDRMRTVEFNYYTCGLKGMPIKSSEEAKYKHSDGIPIDNLPDILQRKDELTGLYRFRDEFCRRIQLKLIDMNDEEIEMLYYRYEQGLTLRMMGKLYCCSKDVMLKRINRILAKF